ncbi:ankyrin repeat-containing domain protein [Mycena epipterygia]|nr:ankyrin repeat-containing domain protein [Mycena epipterygia]
MSSNLSQFDNAVAYLSNASSLSNVTTAVKLELYGLFKCVTVKVDPGSTAPTAPTTPRPGIFDFTGRAKWDAWSAASTAYSTKADAENRYLEIARTLGWTESAVLDENADTQKAEDEWDFEDDDDDDDDKPPTKSRGETGGFGTSVSSMSRPEDEDGNDTSLHGLVVSNNLQGLVSLLQEDSNIDLNARDEFGYTPLHLAADRGHLSVVGFLLDKGVDRTLKDEDGLSALELAQAAGHERIVQLLDSSSSRGL